MKNFKLFDEQGSWYKANFHAHSTVSDGLLHREDMITAYRQQGYSVLMFSEHERYTDTTEYDSEDFLIYPGIERSIMLPDKETFHIQGLYDADAPHHYKDGQYIEVPEYHSLQDVQQIIDELKENGNMVMINHPAWSFNTLPHLHELQGYDFLELYNHNCHVETDLGNSESYYDEILKERWIGALATDDNHNSHRYEDGIHMWDSFGGFVMLQADELSRESICTALKKGCYYASNGPQIHQIEVCDGSVHVQCSPCASIVFKAWPRRGYRCEQLGSSITKASYTLRGGEQWIRIKCIDKENQCAWSNAILITE